MYILKEDTPLANMSGSSARMPSFQSSMVMWKP